MDIKESLEVLHGMNKFGIKLTKKLKDGFQFNDIMELLGDEELRDALTEAVSDIKKVPDEMRDLTMDEGMQMAGVQLSYIPEWIDALKKND